MSKVIIDNETCIGCGACITATDNLEMKEVDGKMVAVPKKSELKDDEVDAHKEAADICPVDAIKIE